MSLTELFFIAVGLSMDAFAVSVCKGLATAKISSKHLLTAGLWFGGFQALMPVIGYLLGAAFQDTITAFDHWIAFILLGFIGFHMVKESLENDCCCKDTDASFDYKTMFLLALATSIDALAVGVTFALLPNVNIVAAVIFIGVITFLLSGIGIKVGNVFGLKYKSKAELAGGIILILMGTKILLEHLEIIHF